ncbi:GNAT family N-acetyltransferase [Bradyrhizobium sp. SZCCHNRI2009]|uniref:GNAT family N-acetyltransferase n=1 Tax=Bradyrhizobium sp. SZCCHNRI2009 TaxID=3057282 RepID=UPI003966F171
MVRFSRSAGSRIPARSRSTTCRRKQARFRGISSALVAELERRAVALGAREIALLSTETAHRFYLARGYVDVGVPAGKFGTAASYPMRKTLGPVR